MSILGESEQRVINSYIGNDAYAKGWERVNGKKKKKKTKKKKGLSKE